VFLIHFLFLKSQDLFWSNMFRSKISSWKYFL